MNKKLSIILCSKNDTYCGDPVQKLNNVLHYISIFSKLLIKSIDFEVVISDWGSSLPLSNLDSLNSHDIDNLKFIHSDKSFCDPLNNDSDFSQPHALNITLKESSGDFFLKIDQDTIVGPSFFHWISNTQRLPSLAFSASRSLEAVDIKDINKILYNDDYQKLTIPEPLHAFNHRVSSSIFPFFGCRRGVLFFSKSVLAVNSGFNEDLIFQNFIHQDFINRCLHKYNIYNLGAKLNFDFYHQEHLIKDNLDRVSNSPLYKNNLIPIQNKTRIFK
jgi:hypothetical protein